MYDPRLRKLAEVLVDYSAELKPHEMVYVEAFDVPKEMVEVLVERIYEAGAIPLISQKSHSVLRKIYLGATPKSMQLIGDIELYKMKKAATYIAMKGPDNITEHCDIPQEKWRLYQKHWWEPAHIRWRVPKTRWVTLRWPTPSLAQQARMSTEAFEEFYFHVCTLDYSKMSKAMKPLKVLLDKTNEVRIKGLGTDLKFSIRDIPVIKGDGHRNLPDGEISTAPVKSSVDGAIAFNAPTIHNGKIFTDVQLEFKDGKVVEANSSDTRAINDILDTDRGARYIGEFGIGLNPCINSPITDIIFDEKIAGSMHLALGNAYDKAHNGNRSKIHWDFVLIQTEQWGGGEVYFDQELIRKDGIFVLDELQPLNPENLKAEIIR